MQVTARGWARNMGPKALLSAGLAYTPPVEAVDKYHPGQTYFQVTRNVRELPRGQRKVNYTIRVSAHAELNLNGSYLVQLELDRDEIAKLFYLTNGDRALPELLETFSTFKLLEAHGLPNKGQEAPMVTEKSERSEAPAIILPFNPAFLIKVDELDLSDRPANCLDNDNIVYIGDLVQMTEAEMLRIPNFGRRSLNEIKEVLMQMGLHLGTEITGWPPENIEELTKRFAAFATYRPARMRASNSAVG